MASAETEVTSAAPRLAHRPALDGLRGLAVLAVVLYHTGVLRGGWIGVDTFFVLSGFLITSLLVTERDRRQGIDLSAFWLRRARRLLPALFTLLAGVAVYAAALASSELRQIIRRDVWAALTYSSNWTAIIGGSGYWQEFVEPSPLAHVWSLAIEEQFYVVWPLAVVLLLRRGSSRRLAAVAAGGTVVLAAWALALAATGASTDRLYLGTDTRAPALLLGAALGALLVGTGAGRLDRVAAPLGWGGLAVLVAAAVTLDGRDPAVYQGLLLAVSVAGAAAVLGAAQLRPSGFGTVLGWVPLAVIGRWSYGIYLAHWPVYLAVRDSTELGRWATTGTVALVSVGLAALSHQFIELPLRHHGLHAWRRPALVPVLAVTCAAATFAATAGARSAPVADAEAWSRPLPLASALAARPRAEATPSTVAPTTDVAPTVAPTVVRKAPTASAPTVPAAPPEVTLPVSTPAGRAARVLVVGDSVGQSLADALTAAGDARGIEVASRAVAGCTLDVERTTFQDGRDILHEDERCPALVLGWGDDVARFQPDVVLVVYGAVWSDWLLGGERRGSCDADFQQHYGSLVDHAIGALSSRGARVAVAPPTYARMYGILPEHDALTDCQRTTYADAVARHADRAALLRLDLAICPTPQTCDTRDGMRRYDGLHFRDDDAAFTAAWLLDQVVGPAGSSAGGG